VDRELLPLLVDSVREISNFVHADRRDLGVRKERDGDEIGVFFFFFYINYFSNIIY
jgi:hypothetical protein